MSAILVIFSVCALDPSSKSKPTMPFTEDEMKSILKAACSTAKNKKGKPKVDPRLLAFILVMRYSGLRISDTTALTVSNVEGNRIQLRQAKTDEHVYVPIPAFVSEALRKIVPTNPPYFFWTGESKLQAAISVWRKRLSDVFKEAKIHKGHSHRFRDTFAVELLKRGVSLDSVSNLLGHQNIKITQKHYAPWVKARQEALDAEVQKALGEVALPIDR